MRKIGRGQHKCIEDLTRYELRVMLLNDLANGKESKQAIDDFIQWLLSISINTSVIPKDSYQHIVECFSKAKEEYRQWMETKLHKIGKN